jgi:hypothetical protein
MRWRVLGPVVAVVVAVAAGVALTREDAPANRTDGPEPVAVQSDAPRLTSLEELAAAADVVVRGQVVATERGRVFGDPGGESIESRLVTLEVAAVLAGGASVDGTVLVEEEGWLEDGTPLIVDGAAPSAVGDDGVWFLIEVGGTDVPIYVVMSAQGRYLVDGDGLSGATGDDPLVAELTSLSIDELTARIAALHR